MAGRSEDGGKKEKGTYTKGDRILFVVGYHLISASDRLSVYVAT